MDFFDVVQSRRSVCNYGRGPGRTTARNYLTTVLPALPKLIAQSAFLS